MNINNIEIFLAICHTRNISKAADVLYLSQSTVSHGLQQLEKEIGFPLIIRSKGRKNVEITQKGLEFLLIAEKWVDINNQTQHFQKNPQCQFLAVGSVDTVVSCTFSGFFKGLIAQKDEQEYSICIYNSDEIYNYIERGTLDVGLVLQYDPSKHVSIVPLLKEPMYLVSKKVSPAAAYHPKDLDSKKEILLNWSHEYTQWHASWFSDKPRPKLTVSTLPLMVSALEDGESWAIVPDSIARYFNKKHALQVYSLLDPPPARSIYFVKSLSPSRESVDNVIHFQAALTAYIEDKYN